MSQFWSAALLGSALVATTPVIASAATFSFSGSIDGSQQVPPNGSPASGFYTATLDGEPDAWSFTYEVSFTGLTDGLALAHIHLGDRGATGPVVHDLDNTAPLVAAGAKGGTISGDWLSTEVAPGVSPADVYNRFLAGGYYFNIHSAGPFLQAGEIRGQIEATAVPEPMTLLGVLAASGLGVAARRKQRSLRDEN